MGKIWAKYGQNMGKFKQDNLRKNQDNYRLLIYMYDEPIDLLFY